jgi:hypothetical protein
MFMNLEAFDNIPLLWTFCQWWLEAASLQLPAGAGPFLGCHLGSYRCRKVGTSGCSAELHSVQSECEAAYAAATLEPRADCYVGLVL